MVALSGLTPANVPTCTEARDRMARAHEAAGHAPAGAEQVPTGVLFYWVDPGQTTLYADVFLQAESAQLAASEMFKQKGVCKTTQNTDMNYYQAEVPIK